MERKTCECCGLNKATISEWRDFKYDGYDGYARNFNICSKCFNLNNYWFLELLNAKPEQKMRVIKAMFNENSTKKIRRRWLVKGD